MISLPLMQSTSFTIILISILNIQIQESSAFTNNKFRSSNAPSKHASFNVIRTPLFATSNSNRNIDSTIITSTQDDDKSSHYDNTKYEIKSIASAGLNGKELSTFFSIMHKACNSLNDDVEDGNSSFTFNIQNENNGIQYIKNKSAIPNKIPGVTGRIVLLTIQIINSNNAIYDEDDDNEWLLALQHRISEYMDPILYDSHEENNMDDDYLSAPVYLCYRQHNDDVITLLSNKIELKEKKSILDILCFLIEEEVEEYELCEPLLELHKNNNNENKERFVPSSWIEIDGAEIEYNNNKYFDTSTVMVFDQLIDDKLRQGLLNVTLGKNYNNDDDSSSSQWNDTENGPDPKRWVYGGLSDVPTDDDDDDTATATTTSNSRGLSTEAIVDLCYNDSHKPIKELESLLTKLFSKDIIVTKLPEAVLGPCVSPLTANAPTYNETFNYHIDADPNLCPPSIWTDMYDTYPNRIPGKPRFMSLLIYLNDYWDDNFGATTNFLDPITKDTHKVMPKPGRCILMDQDVLHTVTAPNKNAGLKRPRYSIVWKLILHPTKMNQNMKDNILSFNDDEDDNRNNYDESSDSARKSNEYLKPTFIGSAASTFIRNSYE